MVDETQTRAELLSAAARGEKRAINELVRRHLRFAYAVALAVLGERGDAEDVAQEALVQACAKIEQCRNAEGFAGWLRQITRRLAFRHRRRRRLQQFWATSGEEVMPLAAQSADALLRRDLLAALAQLSERQREVLLLHDLEGWKHLQIAACLSLSEEMSRQTLFQARRRLRLLLGRDASEENPNER